LGLLAAVGVPSYLRYLPKYRLRSAARDLYSNLQLAKMAGELSSESGSVCGESFEQNRLVK
jgi:Tfp pilus assembly protein FimT